MFRNFSKDLASGVASNFEPARKKIKLGPLPKKKAFYDLTFIKCQITKQQQKKTSSYS